MTRPNRVEVPLSVRVAVRVVVGIAALGAGAAALVVLAGSDPAQAAYPGVNGKIAFVSNRVGGQYQVFLMNADGTDVRHVDTRAGGIGEGRDPTWSPDGTRIAFVSWGWTSKGYTADIYSMRFDGSDVQQLTSDPESDYDPTWSPDGSEIAFTSERVGSADLYVMAADGSGVRRLASTSRFRREPAWSPDGSHVVYSSGSDLFVINLDGGGERQLTSAGAFQANRFPQWSPDGTQIGYQHHPNPFDSDLYVIDADGSGQAQLTAGPDWDWFGNWSPDGTAIVLQRRIWIGGEPPGEPQSFESGSGIYTVAGDGSRLTQLQPGGHWNEAPDWQPLPHMARAPRRGGYCMPEPVMRADGTIGTFVDLIAGQPDTDPLYKGATLAALVPGVGLTCDQPYFPYGSDSPYGRR